MSHPAHLPPRSPFQNRVQLSIALGSASRATQSDDGLCAKHHRFPSQGSLLEEQPSWLDELLTDSETSRQGISSLQRSASDPIALLKASSASHSLIGSEGKITPTTAGSETDCVIEAACIYGPNSPRQKSELTYSESAIASSLLENVSQNPSHHLAEDPFTGSRIGYSGDTHNTSCDHIPGKALRHSRQRSRARKLEYIAELERIVDSYEVMEAELAGSVASLFQQHATLSIENKKLKRKIVSLQQQKMIKDGQHHYLKKEVERLKMVYGQFQENKRASCFPVGPLETSYLGTSWQMLDLRKLSIGGNPLLP